MSEPEERFTGDGSDELEAKLADKGRASLDEIKKLIPETMLQSLLLAGGYGRGEGGVLKTSEGDKPYNDME